ncbi:MAG: molybdenum cofactor biosynthesis protein B [Anaerolineaceae bacterium]
MRQIRVGILTVSDRSSRGEREDLSGPALVNLVESQGWQAVEIGLVPDDIEAISKKLNEWVQSGRLELILTTGGTGFAPRDVTPEATLQVIDRLSPGLSEYMRAESMKFTPHAALSRAVSGIVMKTLIINFPGSPRAAAENFNVILPLLPHAVELIQEDSSAEAGHAFSLKKAHKNL